MRELHEGGDLFVTKWFCNDRKARCQVDVACAALSGQQLLQPGLLVQCLHLLQSQLARPPQQ